MNCIFLDFDGVINNWNCFYGVDINNALILKQIVDKTNAKIIATTSQKYPLQRDNKLNYYESNFYLNYVKQLNKLGINIYALTPLCANRSLEIKKYLLENNVDQFVIIDDELVDGDLQEHQVFLDLYKGLQEEHIKPTLKVI